jgi:DNA-binding beta-propeller fold protein YncE
VAAVVAVVTATVAAPLTPAAADPDIAAPLRDDLDGAADLVVDQANARIYISQGTDVLLVTDLQGRTLHELTGLDGAEQLEIDQERGVIYVARPAAAAISVIDTDTMVVRHYPTPGRCPATLAPVDDVVWFSSYCAYGDWDNGTVNAVDLQSGEVSQVGSNRAEAAVTSSPGRRNFVIIYDRGRNPGTIKGYQATVGPDGPHLTLVSSVKRNLVRDVQISPDGSTAVVNDPGAAVLTLPDFQFVGDYQLGGIPGGLGSNYPKPIAFRDDGAVVLGIRWYQSGSLQPTNELHFGPGYHEHYAGDWGGKYFYALVGDPYANEGRGSLALKVVQPRHPSYVQITPSRRRIEIGDELALGLSLQTDSPDSRDVTVYAFAPDGTRTRVARRAVGPAGVSIAVQPGRNTRYVAEYAGDDLASPATHSVKIAVRSRIEISDITDVLHKEDVLYAQSGRTIWFGVEKHSFRSGGCVRLSLAVQPLVQWYYYDESYCVPLGTDGRVEIGIRAPSDTRPHLHRLTFSLAATPDNEAALSIDRQVQFCRRTVPCEPPPPVFVGTTPRPGPSLHLVARN